jgi:hypothetical protein
VTALNGKPLALRYAPAAWFGDNIQRHVYNGGFATRGLTDFSFEIDDSGRPYWVVTVYAHRVGFQGDDATGIVLVDAQTGQMAQYPIDRLPAWVDRVQPQGFVEQQVAWWGEYVHGAFNWSGRDQLKPTGVTAVVPTKDGRTMWYTGIQTVGKDDGTVGFMLVDTRTKDVVFYRKSGAAEDAAVRAIDGLVQAERYGATSPILYDVDGRATYMSTLKDAAGNYKGIGLMAVDDRSIVAWGGDVSQALRAYENKMRSTGVALSSQAVKSVAEGVVTRVARDTANGTTSVYLMLDAFPDRVFVGVASPASLPLMLVREGDRVRIGYADSASDQENIDTFADDAVRLRKSDGQAAVESRQPPLVPAPVKKVRTID